MVAPTKSQEQGKEKGKEKIWKNIKESLPLPTWHLLFRGQDLISLPRTLDFPAVIVLTDLQVENGFTHFEEPRKHTAL